MEEVLDIVNKYNFYPEDVSFMLAFHADPRLTTFRHQGRVVGFALGKYFKKTPSKGESCFELDYVFIIPEHRGQGLFSRCLDDLFEKYKILYIPTREQNMIQILNKKGFKLDKVCLNGIDLSFRGIKS
tara:strand:+ start:685 stop:1068 length:384 start_codon:yes stop_codon:yes gene_type:complete